MQGQFALGNPCSIPDPFSSCALNGRHLGVHPNETDQVCRDVRVGVAESRVDLDLGYFTKPPTISTPVLVPAASPSVSLRSSWTV